MIFRRALLLRVLFVLGALLVVGCSKPAPPTIAPKEARVVAFGTNGVELLIKVEATNPNRFSLSAEAVRGTAKLDGRWDLGAVTITKPVVLPPGITTIDVPMSLPWTDMRAVAALAMSPKPVPYVVTGSVTVGGERLHVDVPFTLSGVISREQVAGAGLNAIPKIPGLTVP